MNSIYSAWLDNSVQLCSASASGTKNDPVQPVLVFFMCKHHNPISDTKHSQCLWTVQFLQLIGSKFWCKIMHVTRAYVSELAFKARLCKHSHFGAFLYWTYKCDRTRKAIWSCVNKALLPMLRNHYTADEGIVDFRSFEKILHLKHANRHNAIYQLRFYLKSLIHILTFTNSHNNGASIQKNRGDKSHRVIIA